MDEMNGSGHLQNAPEYIPVPLSKLRINEIVSVLPGTVIKVCIAAGDQVTEGQLLMVVEAMKMENEVRSPGTGTVQEVCAVVSGHVNIGDVLVRLTEE